MTLLEMEKRIKSLEQKVRALQNGNGNGASTVGKDDWRSTIGMFGNDPVMKEVFDEALRIRERDRAKARRRNRKRSKG